MAKHFEEQKFENNVLYQRIGLIFAPAKNWKTCTMPMTMDEMIAKVLEELSIYFDPEMPELIVQIMDDLCFPYLMNEYNHKMYWLVNPV